MNCAITSKVLGVARKLLKQVMMSRRSKRYRLITWFLGDRAGGASPRQRASLLESSCSRIGRSVFTGDPRRSSRSLARREQVRVTCARLPSAFTQ